MFSYFKCNDGGRGEIRTLGRFAPTQPFQGCTIGHSDTRPKFEMQV